MPPRVLSEEDKAELTPEEIEALEAEDEDDGEEEDEDGAGDGEAEDEPTDPPAKPKPDAEDPPAKADDAPPVATKAADDDVDVDQFRFKPQFTQVEAAALSKAEKDLKAAFRDFSAGNLSDEEYEAKQAELEPQIRDLDFKRRSDERDKADLGKRYVETWGAQMDIWLQQQGIDVAKLDEATITGFDAILKEIETGNLGAGLKMREQMDLARTIFEKRNPGKLPAPPKKGKRPTREALIPPSLADLGSAEQGSAVDDGAFARLDRIMDQHPERIEAELAKLSESRRDLWLQSR